MNTFLTSVVILFPGVVEWTSTVAEPSGMDAMAELSGVAALVITAVVSSDANSIALVFARALLEALTSVVITVLAMVEETAMAVELSVAVEAVNWWSSVSLCPAASSDCFNWSSQTEGSVDARYIRKQGHHLQTHNETCTSGHTTLRQRCINVDATSRRCTDVYATLYKRYVPAGTSQQKPSSYYSHFPDSETTLSLCIEPLNNSNFLSTATFEASKVRCSREVALYLLESV